MRVTNIPVIALTGYLGAGKTSLLNHVLRTPRARVGVIINDFGALNVDAGLVTGQIDEPSSIAGGCVCCLPDNGGLDEALTKLADPRLDLDAIIVETSGLADPVAVARLIRFSGVAGVRPGGIVDVIDATTHFAVVDCNSTSAGTVCRGIVDCRQQTGPTARGRPATDARANRAASPRTQSCRPCRRDGRRANRSRVAL